ncbi:Gag-polypeptide of LTR copia-type [Sesbania bispinosa]|nr:Gag-polypeptide of LTR copia-type [Sesbania bispinosa]
MPFFSFPLISRWPIFLSPYHITPSDNSSLQIVSHPLEGDNFNSWYNAMHLALVSRNKIVFVNGSLPKPPETDENYASWVRNNNIVASWINNSLSKKIAAGINYTSTAAEKSGRTFNKDSFSRTTLVNFSSDASYLASVNAIPLLGVTSPN